MRRFYLSNSFCLLLLTFAIILLQGFSSDRSHHSRIEFHRHQLQPNSVFNTLNHYFSLPQFESESPRSGSLKFRTSPSHPLQLSLRGGAKERDLNALRKKAETFWIPVIEKIHGKTRQIWEPVIWDIIDLESSGEWGRIQPGEPEEDLDDDVLDLIHSDADGSGRRSTYDAVGGSEKGRMASAALAEQLGNAGTNSSEIERRWWDSVDRDNVDRELLVEWFEETTCCGVGNHSWLWQRFGGERRRCRAHFASDDETDEDMILRHFAGYESNETLAGLRRLKIAAKSPAPPPHRPLNRPLFSLPRSSFCSLANKCPLPLLLLLLLPLMLVVLVVLVLARVRRVWCAVADGFAVRRVRVFARVRVRWAWGWGWVRFNGFGFSSSSSSSSSSAAAAATAAAAAAAG